MGGRIWVESRFGEGSVFSFAVPLDIWTGPLRPAVFAAGSDDQAPLPALHILLVEDYPDNRTITLAYMQETPYIIEVAENGLVAYEKFIAGYFDLD